MDERFVVDTPTLAEILSVSDRRIQQLAADGVLPRLQDPASATSKGSKDAEEIDQQLKAEKLRRAKAEADLREDLRDRERAKLLHADDVMTVLSDCMSQIKAKVLALPARLTLPLLGQKDPSLVNELLTESVVELLNQLRTYAPEDFCSPDLPELQEQNEQAEQEEASE
jgi:phage terminase Nu1 subunit (DNA packaging protein)